MALDEFSAGRKLDSCAVSEVFRSHGTSLRACLHGSGGPQIGEVTFNFNFDFKFIHSISIYNFRIASTRVEESLIEAGEETHIM